MSGTSSKKEKENGIQFDDEKDYLTGDNKVTDIENHEITHGINVVPCDKNYNFILNIKVGIDTNFHNTENISPTSPGK